MASWTDKQIRFVEEYPIDFNATAAARRAGYAGAEKAGYRLMRDEDIAEAIQERMDELEMDAREATVRQAQFARASVEDCYRIVERGDGTKTAVFDLVKAIESGRGHLIKKVKETKYGWTVETYNARKANETIMKQHGLLKDRLDVTSGDEPITDIALSVHQARKSRLTEEDEGEGDG